jgi:hypothetical protein
MVRPVDERLQGLLPEQRRSDPARQETEAIVHTLRDLLHAHRAHARRRQFDRQRDAVQTTTGLRDGSGVLSGQAEVGSMGARPLQEQPHGVILRDDRRKVFLSGRQLIRIRRQQRGHAPGMLAGNMERFPAGCQYLHLRTGAQQGLRQRRAGLHDMFTVVQKQEQGSGAGSPSGFR